MKVDGNISVMNFIHIHNSNSVLPNQFKPINQLKKPYVKFGGFNNVLSTEILVFKFIIFSSYISLES